LVGDSRGQGKNAWHLTRRWAFGLANCFRLVSFSIVVVFVVVGGGGVLVGVVEVLLFSLFRFV
jgi:hypothetical protein